MTDLAAIFAIYGRGRELFVPPMYNDISAMARGQPTNAIITGLKKKARGIHPKGNHIRVDLTGTKAHAKVSIYTDGSKTEIPIGARLVVVSNCREIHNGTQRLSKECTVFQAELCGINMAVDWILNLRKRSSFYAINVDSKAV
jgi:hypothetical protein